MARQWVASEVNATQLTSITAEQNFDFGTPNDPLLEAEQVGQVEVAVAFPAGNNDDALVKVYSSTDGTNFNAVYAQLLIARVPSGTGYSPPILIRDIYAFRVTVQRNGSTDTLTSADASYRYTEDV